MFFAKVPCKFKLKNSIIRFYVKIPNIIAKSLFSHIIRTIYQSVGVLINFMIFIDQRHQLLQK